MSQDDPTLLTNTQLVGAPAETRAHLVEAYLLASISALHPEAAGSLDASHQLADIGIDSLQIVELKFGLDQVLGHEVDVELIVSNPTVGELAANAVQAAGL